MKYNIPFIKPSFPSSEEIADDYKTIVESNWFTNFGPFENRFRTSTAKFIANDVNVCTVANATLGLEIAIKVLFRAEGRKKEVIVPSFTFAAGPEMLIEENFTPVFIDVQESNWQPSIFEAREYIKKNDTVAGILLCNIFGVGNKEITEWENLARDANVPLIIDSAAGFGSRYDDSERVGSRGDCEVFSLHATKPFAVGEGGLVVSKNRLLIEKMREAENFGFNEDKQIGIIGTNAKLQELNCAIGLRQLQSFEDRLAARQKSLQVYKEELSELSYFFQENDDLSTVPFASTIAPNPEVARRMLKILSQKGIEARKYYAPLHLQTLLKEKSVLASDFKVTDNIYSRIISLPLHDSMSSQDIKFITGIIKENSDEKS